MVLVKSCTNCGLLYDPNTETIECAICKAPLDDLRIK